MKTTDGTFPYIEAGERRGLRSCLFQLLLVLARIMLTIIIGIPAVAWALVCSGCTALLCSVREIGSDD